MSTNNPIPYIPLTETADEVYQRLMSMLYTLHDEHRDRLGAPLARMLADLAEIDRAALADIDAQHGVKVQ